MPVMEPEIFFRAPYSSQRECGICGFKLSQWTSEAKFVAIRIGQVEEPLAPFGVARCRVWSVAGRDHARIQGVDVGIVEDDPPPPRPISLRGLCDEIEKAGSGPKTCKRGVTTTMNDLKSQHAIEGDAASRAGLPLVPWHPQPRQELWTGAHRGGGQARQRYRRDHLRLDQVDPAERT